MSSQAFANYSNQAASLRSTLEGSIQTQGQETENDRKAFMQELLQNSSQYSKEKAIEEGGKVFANTRPGGAIIKAVTGKDPTPLKTAAKLLNKKLEDAQAGVDKEGLASVQSRMDLAQATDVAESNKAAATATRSAAQAEVDALPDAAGSLRTLTDKSSALSDAQETATRTSSELARASQAPSQNFSDPTLDRLNQAQDADKAAQADLASKQGDLDAATSARGTAADAASQLDAAGNEERTAASAFKTATEAESTAKDVADVAKVARVEKAAVDAKRIAEVGEASDETGNPIGLAIGAALLYEVAKSGGGGSGYPSGATYMGTSSDDDDWDYLPGSSQYRCRSISTGQFVSDYLCSDDVVEDSWY